MAADWYSPSLPTTVPLWAAGLGVVVSVGSGTVLRNLAGEQGRAAGSGGGAPLRVVAVVDVDIEPGVFENRGVPARHVRMWRNWQTR